jgi:protein SCO1/2
VTTALPPRPRRLRGPLLLLGLVVVIAAVVIPTVVVPTLLFPPATPRLDDHGALPPFRLVDHTGADLTNDSLRGHVTIVNFIFTRCDTVCPVTTAKMHTVQDRTNDEPAIKLLSISVDPAHDTVPVLAAFAARNGADDTRWRFARGDMAAIKALVEQGMSIGFDDLGAPLPSGAPNITHSGHFVLIDQDLHIRGYYDSDDWHRIENLMKHARFLTRRGPGAGRVSTPTVPAQG